MFGEIEKMSKNLYRQMMEDYKKQSAEASLQRVNFQIEKKLEDGTVVRANSFNPIMLIAAFKHFLKKVREGGK